MKQSSTESSMARHEESSQSTCTRKCGRTINIDVETESMAAFGMCSRMHVGKTRHVQVRWLWIQDVIRDKVVRFEKGERHRERGRHGNQRPRRTDTSALVAETAGQVNPVQTAPGLDRDSKLTEVSWMRR